jgi:hypothetical protein
MLKFALLFIISLQLLNVDCCGNPSNGFDYKGSDLSSSLLSDYDACCSACTSNSLCVAISWDKATKVCFLKTGTLPSLTARTDGNCLFKKFLTK